MLVVKGYVIHSCARGKTVGNPIFFEIAKKLDSTEANLLGAYNTIEQKDEQLANAGAFALEQEKKASRLEAENAELADEIIRLKAKLYDMMEKASKEG